MGTITKELTHGLQMKEKNIDEKLGSLEGMLKTKMLPKAQKRKGKKKEKI